MPHVRVHETLPVRVLIGPGARHQLPAEVPRLGAGRVFLVATPSARSAADEVAAALGPLVVGRFDNPAVHTPVAVTTEVMRAVTAADADAVVSLGGGSAVGLGKAISGRQAIPHVAVPTTYSGSEVTPVLGETEDGVKTSRSDPALLPGTVVYDPELTLSLPARLTLTSAMNAMAHVVEALWAPNASAASDAIASGAAEGILTALPTVLADLSNLDSRAELQEACWLAGLAMAQTRMGLQHRLAHILGAAYDLPHADLHTLLLPHVMAFNLPAAPRASARLARLAGTDPVGLVSGLVKAVPGPTSLAALGVPRAGLPELAERVATSSFPNPRPVTVESVTRLFEEAW